MNHSTHVYDKAKYHDETIQGHGLPEEHAYHHTTFFLSWLVKSRLMSAFFETEGAEPLGQYRAGKVSVNELYEWWDTCLISDMLSDEGNAFAMYYFDFDAGLYLSDYSKHLQKALPTEFHVVYTSEHERLLHQVIDSRYEEWKKSQV